ncbi:MAG: toprim domain-containing protein, partial [Rhodospirillaceae bacterium]
MTLEPGEALWLVEGCLDALSLWVNGVKAVAILSAGNFPETYLKGVSGLDLHLVWALDNDPAGNGFTKKHAAAARRLGFSSRAAIIPQKEGVKTDWNDSHQAGLLKTEDREGNPIRFLERCRFHGDLLLAESPKDKGVIIWKRKKSTSFAIDHNYQTYWWELDPTEYTRVFNAYADNGLAPPEGMTLEEMAVQDACKCWNIANCSFRFLYYQYDHLTDEAFYYCLVRFPSGKNTKKGTFTGSQVAAASEFKKRLLSVSAGGLWKGTGSQLDWIINHHLTDIRTVETLQFIGYSRDHQAYIFGDLAVKDGRVYQKNDEDFFELGSAIHKISIKSLNKSVGLKIGNRATYSTGWVDLVYRAFGPRGIVAAAYWFMSLFAEQIRDRWESWPFLEIVGEAGAGKSTLIEFLWRLVGRSAFEGLDPNKSTDAAIARSLTQVSNLPVVLLESDREGQDAKVKSFDWDALKTLFNGRPYRSRGVKNSGTDTDDSPFRGAMVISQNNPVTGSDAIMSRIVHLFFTTAHHSDAGKAAADALAVTKTETVSHFVTMATVQEKDILERFGPSFRHHEAAIAKDPALRLRRIAKCHGQMAAALDCFASLVALPEAIRQDAQAMIYQAARERQASLITEHAVIGQFWDYIEVIGFDVVNHANDGSIALNLAQIDQLFHHRGFRMPCERADLLRHLKEGKRYRYLEQKPISSKHADYYG